MFVIILAAILVFVVTVLILLASVGQLPFFAKKSNVISSAQSDRAIFRQQMAEIETLRKQKLLDAESAEQARVELARNILAANRKIQSDNRGSTRTQDIDLEPTQITNSNIGLKLVLSVVLILIPVFTAVVYYYQGQPEESDRPFSAFMRRDIATLNPQEKIVYLEVLTSRNPENGKYADQLADVYLEAQRFQDAANAYNHALTINGDNAHRLLGYALALTGFNDGIINQQATEAFENVLRLDPQNSQAQLFLARGLVQDGKKQQAIALLQQFLDRTPADSPWRQNLQTAITALQNPEKLQNRAQANTPNSSAVSEQERAFITQNLTKLEEKVATSPHDLQAWTMLIRAYLLIGETDKAKRTFDKGMDILPQQESQQLLIYGQQKGLAATN